MLNELVQTINQMSEASVILSLSIMLFGGFLMSRIAKMVKLPNVTAYILTGILIGPSCLNLLPDSFVQATSFLPDVALAFIAFSVGEFFKSDRLRRNGMRVIWIAVVETATVALLVFAASFYLLHLDMAFCVVLAALSAVTAPSSTLMTIRQYKAHGDTVDTLLQVIALDDVIGLLGYSVAISIAMASISHTGSIISTVLQPVLLNIGVVLLGCVFGVLLKLFMDRKHSSDNRLIISIGLLFAFCGLCSALNVSPLLGCMAMGMVYINMTDDEKLFMQMNYFSPPILLLFFVRSGVNFDLNALFSNAATINGTPLLAISAVYLIVRIIGKYAGAWTGCQLVHKNHKTRDNLGLALLPQAGVAIGLAAMSTRVLTGTRGSNLETVILASSILFELIGPICAKFALYRSGSFSKKLEDITSVSQKTDIGEERPGVDVLIDRIAQIQKTLPKHDEIPEEESAFLEAAAEQETDHIHRGRFLNT